MAASSPQRSIAIGGNAFLLVGMLVGMLLASTLGACTTASTVESMCSNHDDEDNDGLFDCDDPDCQASNDCLDALRATISPPDAGHRRPPLLDAGQHDTDLGDAWIKPPEDAALVDPLPPDAQTAPPDPDEDAGPPDACKLCTTTEVCIDGMCRPAASSTSGAYYLRVFSASVPINDTASRCYDACLLGIIGLCGCSPDPYVRAVLFHDGMPTLVGMTGTVLDTTKAEFPPMDMELELVPGDVLQLEAMDSDEEDQDDKLYDCLVDLHELSSAEPVSIAFECDAWTGIAPPLLHRILGELRPRLFTPP